MNITEYINQYNEQNQKEFEGVQPLPSEVMESGLSCLLQLFQTYKP